MIKLTFKTEQEYISFARTACIFTHLRAYNGGANLWKEEDLPYIRKMEDEKLRKENFEEWKKCLEVYKRAKKEYGEDVFYWRDAFSDYPAEVLLRSLGFDYDPDEDEDGVTYVASDLDIDLNELTKNNEFPKTFPCVTCLENGSKYDGANITHVYLTDFNQSTPPLKFDWLEQNVRNFWAKGDGYID